MQQSRHPIREGRMSCSSCHESHGAGNKPVKSTERVNDLCLSCHAKYQGPFVFEHSPVEESCLTCHDPLDYMEAGIGNFVVRATGHDPGSDYSRAVGMLNTNVSVAATKGVEFFVSHKMTLRDGVHQGLTMSHCANCHAESFARKMDETTNTLAAGARTEVFAPTTGQVRGPAGDRRPSPRTRRRDGAGARR